MLLILKTRCGDEDTFRGLLQRLDISLEAQVVNSEEPGRDGSSLPASIIFTGAVTDTSEPVVIMGADGGDAEDDEASCSQACAIWKLSVLLSRPRMRLHEPSVVFSAAAIVNPEPSPNPHHKDSGYLPSGTPSGLNILQSFANDPSLGGIRPRLSALRVSRVAPVTHQPDAVKRIRGLSQLKISISAVLHTRIRLSRPNVAPPSSTLIAILEVDFTPNFNCEVFLDEINLSVQNGIVRSLNDEASMELPLSCVSHDHITFLYHITPHDLDLTPKASTRDLAISIKATAQVIPHLCTPCLSLSWTTPLDFTTPVNPGFGLSTGVGIQRSHRPTQLSIGGSQGANSLKPSSTTLPDSLPALEAPAAAKEPGRSDLGITMSFTGPPGPIRPGDIFSWTVYVVNRSIDKSTHPPRKLALVAIPKRRQNEVRPMRPPSTGSRRRGEMETADAVLDENVLHAMQKTAQLDTSEVVCLSADTRVGPLAPGACHVVELRFLALQEGIAELEAIRVVDLGSQEHVDIRDLPAIIVQAGAA